MALLSYLQENSKLLISCIIAIVTLLSFSISYLFSKNRDNQYIENIYHQANSQRIFILDFSSDEVKYFTLSNLRLVKTISIDDFFAQYPESNNTKVRKWIEAVLDESRNAPLVLETLLALKNSAKPACVLLKIDRVDYENKRIHLTSFLLKKSLVSNQLYEKRKVLSSKSSVVKLLNSQRKVTGFTITFKFAYKNKADAAKEIDPLLFGTFKNYFYEYINDTRFLVENSPNSLSLIDIDSKSVEITASSISHSIISGINKYLSLTGEGDEIDIYVGGVDHSSFTLSKDDIIRESINYSEFAQMEGEPNKIHWFIYGKKISLLDFESTYRTEVERIMTSKKLKNQFRLIMDTKRLTYFGYLSKAIVDDTFFDDINELKDYASRTGDSKELVSNILNRLLPSFSAQKPASGLTLYIPCRIDEKGYVLTSLARLSKFSDFKIALVLDEEDVLNRLVSFNDEEFINDVKFVQSKGYEVAISISHATLELSNNIYTIFNSFVVNFSLGSSETSLDNQIRASLHNLVEKLIKYKKPIICSGIDGWDSIELLVRSGLEYVSSNTISPYSDMVQRIDPKSKKKIESMKG